MNFYCYFKSLSSIRMGFLALFAAFSWPFLGKSLASDFHSPRTAALGGAGHASPLLNDAIFLNPSYASLLQTYSIGLDYTTFETQKKDREGRAYSVSIQDGRSPTFQAGAAYTLREDGAFVHLGVSKAVSEQLGIGIGAKFFFSSAVLTSGRDGVFSMTYLLAEEIQSSITVDNIMETNTGKTWGLYREFTLGLKYNTKGILLLYLDPHYVPNLAQEKFGHEAGVEIVVMNDFFLRGGHLRRANVPYAQIRGNGMGLGFGWIAPRISLDYAYTRINSPVALTAHSMGATMYF